MRNPWELNLHPSSSKITGAAVDDIAYPPLSRDVPSKRQSKYAYLTVPPEVPSSLLIVDAAQGHNFTSESGDSSTSLPIVVEAGGTMTQEHTFTVDAAGTGTQEHNLGTGLQAGSIKKDWSPSDDEGTCPDLLPTGARTDRALPRPRGRLPCFTQFCEDGEPVAQKPSTTGTANLSASTHGSSSEQSSQSQHKNQDDESTGADNEPTTGTANLSTSTHAGADNGALEYPVAFPL